MRLASFLLNGSESFGIVTNEGFYPIQANFKDHTPNLMSVFSEQKTMDLQSFCEEIPLPLSDVSLLPPIPNPGKIICAGMNYRKPYPVDGVAAPDPGNGVIFARHTETLVGHSRIANYRGSPQQGGLF